MSRRARLLAALDASLVAAFLVFYVSLVHRQGNHPVLWVLAFLTVAAICAVLAAARRTPTPLVANLVILAICAVLGMLSVGVLLLPALASGVWSYTIGKHSARS
jgi:cytochrome bd-type quinol oxidase subunit 2